jgi:anti-sigma regulatory factor (Ser/Thr protein kinase)
MSATRSVLRATVQRLIEPGAVLEHVNDHLCPDMPEKMFVTCLYALLDPRSGVFRFANAGHDLPYVKTANGVVSLRARGMPLGLMPGMAYEEKQAVLAPGDCVLLHSDGIVEAHDAAREMFGFPRLKETVGDAPGGQALIDRVLSDLAAFTGPDAEQEDDITMVTLQRSAGVVLDCFDVPSEAGNERAVIDRVEQAVRGLALDAARLERLKTAVGEATMNAMEHGNGYREDLPVAIKVIADGDLLRVRITDKGGGKEIPHAETPNLEAKLAGEQKPRGWGLFLIERMVDEMQVESDDVHHTVELGLHLRGDEDGDA